MHDIVNPLAFSGDQFVICNDRMERWDKGVMQMKVIIILPCLVWSHDAGFALFSA